jgi:hypothetical protein
MARPEPRLEFWPDFLRILARCQPGSHVTVNALRDDLDAAQIPTPARGGLFSQAVNRGYLEPVRAFGGDLFVASTGSSANHSSVRVYTLTRRPTALDARKVS